LRPNIWPGLALAGAVVIAAVIALVLLGSAGPSGGNLPSGSVPGDTVLFPSQVAGGTPPGRPHKPPPARPGGMATGGSAAEAQYGVDGNGGLVLGGP
jgi:hypothetical protein